MSWALIGLGIGGAAASALSFVGEGDDARARGIGFAGGAAASLVIGLLVRAAWPAPTETFETAYNQALKVELEKRVVGDPTAMKAPRELTVAEKECVRRRSSSPLVFNKIGIHRCIAKGARDEAPSE